MTAVKKRIVGRTAENAHPRLPDPALALSDLTLMVVTGLQASIELRALGMPDLADMLCEHIDGIHAVQRAVAVRAYRLRGGV